MGTMSHGIIWVKTYIMLSISLSKKTNIALFTYMGYLEVSNSGEKEELYAMNILLQFKGNEFHSYSTS